jgi:predicted RNA-binding Zn ribbon-like protein
VRISPATPAHARLVVEAANSYDAELEADAWATPADLARWLAQHGASDARVSTSDRLSREEHEAALRVRDALRHVILERGDPRDLGFADSAKAFPVRVGFEAGTPTLVPAADGGAAGVARILAAVAQSAFDGSWERIKMCPAGDCLVAFYDESRNRSRAWCSMEVCGNRTKTRSYRARHPQG